MPEKLIVVRESEWREMLEVLAKCAEGWGNAVEFDLLPPSHHSAATYLRDKVRAALAKSEAAVGQPVAHAYVVAGECEQIEWGTDAVLPDDPALVWLYPHPTPDGCGREGERQWGGPERNREVCVNCGATRVLEVPDTKGPYEARFVDGGMPSDCCEYGVISLSEGREVCRVWREQDARAIASALSAFTAGGDDG